MAHSYKSDCSLNFRTDDTRRFSVGALQYVALRGIKQSFVPLPVDRQLLTVVPTDPRKLWTKARLERYITKNVARDDVSSECFRKFLLFCGTSAGAIKLGDDVLRYLSRSHIRHAVVEIGDLRCDGKTTGGGLSSSPLVEGPYLWAEWRLRPVCRLFEDKAVAFVDCLYPSNGKRQYGSMDMLHGDSKMRLASVPPRRPSNQNSKARNGIEGQRVIVKDIFDMTGLRKTACNRAYFDLSSPAKGTAPMIQRLIECGADIIGKARLSSMVSREEPSESFDYEVPFNPRADGYQSPAGSSSGSAAAVAAYDWLDYGVGTDSTGSARRPAMANGVFSIRISNGVLPAEGMVPCFPLFDTPAVFTRDIRQLGGFVDDWCNRKLSRTVMEPTSIIMPTDYFPVDNCEQQAIIDHFVRDLSKCFQITIRTVCLQHLWEDSPPFEARGQSLYDYLQDVGQNSFFYDFYHSSDSFREEYERKYHRAPAVNAVTKWRWKVAKGISRAQRDEAVRRLGVYKKWLLERVLVGEYPIVVLPVMDAVPTYRDDAPSPPATQEAWHQLWIAPILGSPEVTLPIGQIPYNSRVSDREEQLPVAISLMGLPGTDISLINTAKAVLEKSGRPCRVATGREMFAEEGWEMVERTASF